MSKHELLDAYVEGRIGRRAFVRGLMGLGASLTAAAAYAVALKPASAAHGGSLYHPVSKEQCKNGGFAAFGFKNQGQCIQFVNTGK